MNKIVVSGLHRDRKAVLEELQKKELVEVGEPDFDAFEFTETAKSIAQFEKYMQAAEAALAVLDVYAPEKSGFFKGKRSLPAESYHMSSTDSEVTLHTIYHIAGLSDKIGTNRESVGQINAKQAALEPYLTLGVPMKTRETGYTLIRTGTLSGKWTSERLKNELEENGLDAAHFEILGAAKERTYVWLVFPSALEERVGAFLQKSGFAEPQFELSNDEPRNKTQALEDAKAALNRETAEYEAELRKCGEHRRDIELFYDHMSLRKDKYRVLSKTGLTEYAFFITGYIPERYAYDVKEIIESKYAAYVELSEPDGEAPVAFSNSAFSAPVEGITETYSMPSATDVDPNPVMAFFYYLFFGMMFSDAGYGLIMMLVCGFLGFGKRLDASKRRSFKMFFFCGVSTVFWGLMYGGFFGDIVYTVSTTFFGREVSLSPIWLDPISKAMELLIFSVALGIVQILIGMGIRFYMLCRMKKITDAICDVGFWMIVLIGICALAAGAGTAVPALITAGTWIAATGVAGLVVTGGRKSRSAVGKLLGGVIKLYDITGYVSDALSYCRLMALGLATGAIANVSNMLGTMFGSGVFGAVMFVVIAAFGHSLNFAMNALGAYVHTNRLQYVEFFSKFYEGGGRKFEPFRMNTKYNNFSE